MFPSAYFPPAYFAPRYWPRPVVDETPTVNLADILLTSVVAIQVRRTAEPLATVRTVEGLGVQRTVKGVI